MNIFVLDSDPILAASYHCDKHVVKMILESSQMLSTAVRILDSDYAKHNPTLMQIAYQNHPCTIWTRESKENFRWHTNLLLALHQEYRARYCKIHSASYLTNYFEHFLTRKVWRNLPTEKLTPHPLCMPDNCKPPGLTTHAPSVTLAVLAYRTYYLTHKSHFAKWHNSPVPEWYQKAQNILSAS